MSGARSGGGVGNNERPSSIIITGAGNVRFQTLARYLHGRDSALLNQFGHLRNGTQTHFAPSYPAARILVRACL